MGCDIHCYIEFVEFKTAEGADYWMPFGGRINPGRNYKAFERLAGVRGEDANAIVPPRGMPSDPAWSSQDDNRLFISATPGDSWVAPERAAQWVAQGSSKYCGHDNSWVTNPDWHSHSWLTHAEFSQLFNGQVNLPSEYYAVHAAMKALEDRGHKTRLVFWFDN